MKKIILVISIFSLTGCARIVHQANLTAYPFYITVQRGYPPEKAVTFSEKDINFKPIDNRIEEYLRAHKVDEEAAKNMRNYVIAKGMNKEQVLAITGKDPDGKEYTTENEERWIYGSIVMQGRAVIITFKDDCIIRIDDKYWDPCRQC